MAESLNTRVELVTEATSFLGLGSYGKIMIGDRAFEYYNDRKVEDYIQIPWDEIDTVVVDVLLGGHWIPRFKIVTKRNGSYHFSAHRVKDVLRVIRRHIPKERTKKAMSFTQNIRYGIAGYVHDFKKKKK